MLIKIYQKRSVRGLKRSFTQITKQKLRFLSQRLSCGHVHKLIIKKGNCKTKSFFLPVGQTLVTSHDCEMGTCSDVLPDVHRVRRYYFERVKVWIRSKALINLML